MNDKHTNNGQGELSPENASVEERTMAMVTAYALDQVTEIERKAVEGLLEKNSALRQHVESIRQLGELLRNTSDAKGKSSGKLRNLLTQRLEAVSTEEKDTALFKNTPDDPNAVDAPSPAKNTSTSKSKWNLRFQMTIAEVLICVGIVAVLATLLMPAVQSARESARRAEVANNTKQIETSSLIVEHRYQEEGNVEAAKDLSMNESSNGVGDSSGDANYAPSAYASSVRKESQASSKSGMPAPNASGGAGMPGGVSASAGMSPGGGASVSSGISGGRPMGGVPGMGGMPGYSPTGSMGGSAGPTGGSGPAQGQSANRGTASAFNQTDGWRRGRGSMSGKGHKGAGSGERPEEEVDEIESQAEQSGGGLGGGQGSPSQSRKGGPYQRHDGETDYSDRAYYYRDGVQVARARRASVPQRFAEAEDFTEQYETYIENSYFDVKDVPLSTFAIDVDTASYANLRRFLNNNQLPPPSSIRMEEMLNYFTYSYPTPTDSRPFAVHLEATECPWNREHRLVRVGLKGKEIHKAERPSSNLVFLIDTSGSMQTEDKLPLLKSALTMLTRELSAKDRVTIVTYAGTAGLVLPPTSGNDKEKIISTLDQLLAGGSTHGSAGIMLAYEQAKANFIQEGTNRVILCTDGDLNVGVTSDDALVELIKERAKTGVYLSVMGFGTGNLKDGKLEKIADHGNGVYAYIDGLREARKVFVDQMSGSLVTIAKDVKIQLEFNPKQIQAYRLLGYENRVMENKDFRNDKKDAGEIGAGHTVTALYEIVPAGATPDPAVKLKYQPVADRSPALAGVAADDISKELLTVRLRYKNPEATENDPATEFETALANPGATVREASQNFRFASAVAMAGLVLRQSHFRGDSNLDAAIEIASTAIGDDPQGWRTEFVDLLRKARALQGRVE